MRAVWCRVAQRRCGTLVCTRTAYRYCSSSEGNTTTVAAHGDTARSAVNVDAFTLNNEVVQRDLDSLARWNAMAAAIAAARGVGDDAQVLRLVEEGLARLATSSNSDSVSDTATPIQCEAMLCMEAAQAHYNLADYDAALAHAQRALTSLEQGGTTTTTATATTNAAATRDYAQMAEVRTVMAQVLCKQGKAREAHALFAKVLQWVDVDAKTAPPMQAVAALQLRRTLLTGLAESLMLQADNMLASSSSSSNSNSSDDTNKKDTTTYGADVTAARELYGKALDTFIDALNAHLDESDVTMVKTTLLGIVHCFEALGDVAQAAQTWRKYARWCSRHEDAAGVTYGKAQLRALQQRHSLQPDEEDDECTAQGQQQQEGDKSTAA